MNTSFEMAKTTSGEFILPVGYLLRKGGDGFLLNKVFLKEMTGKEEDLLTNERLSFFSKLIKIVSGCIETISDGGENVISDRKTIDSIVPMLTVSDLTSCAFGIRIITVGNTISQTFRCPNENCAEFSGKQFSWIGTFNLEKDFPVIPCKLDPMKRVMEFTTSRGNRITWTFMTGESRLRFENRLNKKETATAALMMRLLTLNDKPVSVELLQALSMAERKEIRDVVVDQEGGIETSIDAVCKKCGNEFKADLDVGGYSFFFPSEPLED